jgi:hypothetical protein
MIESQACAQIDNHLIHQLTNEGDSDRIHLVVDVAEEPASARVILQPGVVCHYLDANRGIHKPGC